MIVTISQILPTRFHLRIYDLTTERYLLGDIYTWLSQLGRFQMPFILHIFSTLSVKYKQSFENRTQVLCHKTVDTIFQRKRNYVVSMILQIRVKPGQLVVFKCQENKFLWISFNLTTAIRKIHETRKYE